MVKNNEQFSFCLGLTCSFSPLTDKSQYEDIYQNIYKPLFSYLYNKSETPFLIYMSGLFLEWVEKFHQEVIYIIEELVSKKRVEFLGGGYYAPLYPLLPSTDRVGQTELLTTTLRKITGKRPRGAFLPASAWDPCIISSFTTCGIEYVLIDYSMFISKGDSTITGLQPVVVEDNGKTIIAIPVDYTHTDIENQSFESLLQKFQTSPKIDHNNLITIMLSHHNLNQITNSKKIFTWIENLIDFIKTNFSKYEFTLPSNYIKTNKQFLRTCIPAGYTPQICLNPNQLTSLENITKTPLKQLIVMSNYLTQVYSKMMYVHALTNQIRGDKARKNNAREQLWQSQNSSFFLYPLYASPKDLRKLKNLTYRNLLIAEKTSRIRGVFSASINTYDFDMDGLKEYLCQLENYNCYIHSNGGSIFELDVLPVNKNYIDSNTVKTGLFIDHFFTFEDAVSLAEGSISSLNPVFSDSYYSDTGIDSSKMELNLKTTGFFGTFQQPISLKKQFMFRNEGLQVQYILKNESPFPLSGMFTVELDLAIQSNGKKTSTQAIYSNDVRKEGSIVQKRYEDVSWLRIDDGETGARFTIESNENPSITVLPTHSGLSVKIFLSWKVELSPNFETEKLTFLKISC